MKTYLAKERLNSGGYNARGRYFGAVRGASVYRYDISGDWQSGYIRARSRAEAREILRKLYPQLKLRFYR
jgi:hypothetical protein